jgi:hypothetical protein
LIFGQFDFGTLSFTINLSHFFYGDFINSLITFVSVAAAVFFFVIKPMNYLQSCRCRAVGVEVLACVVPSWSSGRQMAMSGRPTPRPAPVPLRPEPVRPSPMIGETRGEGNSGR